MQRCYSTDARRTTCARGDKPSASPTEKGETTLFVVSPFPVFGTLFHSETTSRAAYAEIQPFRRNHACLAARNKRPNHV